MSFVVRWRDSNVNLAALGFYESRYSTKEEAMEAANRLNHAKLPLRFETVWNEHDINVKEPEYRITVMLGKEIPFPEACLRKVVPAKTDGSA
jgi:hypothetical protein